MSQIGQGMQADVVSGAGLGLRRGLLAGLQACSASELDFLCRFSAMACP